MMPTRPWAACCQRLVLGCARQDGRAPPGELLSGPPRERLPGPRRARTRDSARSREHGGSTVYSLQAVAHVVWRASHYGRAKASHSLRPKCLSKTLYFLRRRVRGIDVKA